jgi:hypothetical protein
MKGEGANTFQGVVRPSRSDPRVPPLPFVTIVLQTKAGTFVPNVRGGRAATHWRPLSPRDLTDRWGQRSLPVEWTGALFGRGQIRRHRHRPSSQSSERQRQGRLSPNVRGGGDATPSRSHSPRDHSDRWGQRFVPVEWTGALFGRGRLRANRHRHSSQSSSRQRQGRLSSNVRGDGDATHSRSLSPRDLTDRRGQRFVPVDCPISFVRSAAPYPFPASLQSSSVQT